MEASETPMFSSVDSAIIYSLNALVDKPRTYDELGGLLPKCSSNSVFALKKYGECHSKLLALVGLATIEHCVPRLIVLTELGMLFYMLDNEEREEFFSKMLFSTKIIKNLMIQAKYATVSIGEELSSVHSGTTVNRRRVSIKVLLKTIQQNFPNELDDRLSKIVD